jgi:serine protease Do
MKELRLTLLADRRGCACIVFFVATMCVPGPGWAQSRTEAAKQLSSAFSEAAKAAMPAVVSIKVEKAVEVNPVMGLGGQPGFNDPFGQFGDDFLRRFFGERMPQRQSPRKYRERGQGSGFIISEDGYILTNNHVVGDVDKMTVELQDGRVFTDARLIGTDPDSEVALIKINGHNFPVLPLGDSAKAEIGDWVIAIGNPFGLNE